MKPKPLQSKTSSFRLDPTLRKPVNDWLEQNKDFNLSLLINMAIRKFISKKQTLESVEVVSATDEEVKTSLKKLMKKHAHMLEKLK